MNFLAASLLLFRTHLVRILLTRRIALCALGALVPPALAWVVVHLPEEHPPTPLDLFLDPGWFLTLQVLVPISALIAGSAVISEEIEDRTLTYLFTRPVPRAAVLVGRWLATASILAVLLGASVGLHVLVVARTGPAAPGSLPGEVVRPLLAMAILGGAVYSALFAAAGTFLRHPMIVGLGYTFAIEGFLANFPGKSQTLTVQYHLRSFLIARAPELWGPVSEVPLGSFEGGAEALLKLAAILVGALVAGSLVLSRRQYLLAA